MANKACWVLLLSGTVMSGYVDGLFLLFWRTMPKRMIGDGYRYNRNSGGSGTAAMAFMREHWMLKDLYKETI